MTLSTRLTLAIVALVVATAGAVGFLTYRNLSGIAVPRSLTRADLHARALANDIANVVASSRADVKVFRNVIGLDEIMALSLNPSLERAGGQTLAEWRSRIERRIVAELETKPHYIVFRIITVADNGRQILRVRRPPGGGEPRIVPATKLQTRGDRNYFKDTAAAPDGAIVISPVELNRDDGVIETPHVPVVRVSTPLYAPDGKLFGMIVLNVDLRNTFKNFDEPPNPDTAVYVVNDQGDYLLHPDLNRTFGFQFGKHFRIQDDFPALASAIASGTPRSGLFQNRNGERFGVSVQSTTLSEGPRVSVIEAMPEKSILAAAGMAVQNSILVGGVIAAFFAALAGVLLAHTLTRPLRQITAAVSGFSLDKPLTVPVTANGEIGVLANAFENMAREVRDKTSAIRHDKEIFEIIMSTMADAVFMIDTNAAVIYENAAAIKLLHPPAGVDRPPFKESQDVFEPDGLTPIAPENWPSIRCTRGDYDNLFELMLRPYGADNLRHVLGSARPIRDAAGKIIGAVVVCRDITEAKKLERQLRQSQKLDAIGQLTGGIAHDFNNMLTVITGTIEILAEGVADRPDLHAIATLIDQAADRGADLTKHLLAFARRQPLQPHNVDINALVIETAKLLRPALGEHIEIESRLEDDADFALIDPSQLSTALLNLAVNARDAMPDGGKLTLETRNVTLDEIYAQAHAEVQPGHYVMIAVSDSGTGIPSHLIEKVFEPFFTTKEVGKGTGLGLSMVYGFVKQSNGHIKVYSEEGHGTTIKLYLPRGAAKLETVPAPAATLAGGTETILVVEDDDMVRNFLITQLHSLGYKTVAAASGTAALAKVDSGMAFNLLFTDVIMPGGMNGRQLADEVIKRRPGMKVLYTSGYTENAIIHHGRLDPGVLLLAKPYRKTDLARMVRQALGTPGTVAASSDTGKPATERRF